MNDKNAENETNKILFAQLVMMLSSSAMQQLGKLVNPGTRKAEIDLEGAQITIDMLSMLEQKTKGNLDNEEARMIGSIVSSLQMNYVETMQSTPTTPEAKKEQPVKDAVPDKEEQPLAAENQNEDKKDPKYHKSYGD
jgi:hypothetical protein